LKWKDAMTAACVSCPEALEVELQAEGVRGVVICRGALVEGGEPWRVRAAAERQVEAGRRVVLDLRAVDRIDARGVGVVAAAAGSALQRGGRSAVVHASGRVRRLLRLSGLAPFVDGLSA
jgi:anti-anti-sigma factor